MEGNRRQQHRIEQYFDCTFLSAWGEQQARISSLSPIGCLSTAVPQIAQQARSSRTLP